ncbi:MAG TPA: hypothetical protein ENN76_03450 [Euryarchaeota archaeon]|nr:hypothetical protein [Euryarchaeota archaeon]
MSKLVAMKSEILGRIFKKAETEQYPFVKPEMPDNYRGAIEFDWKNCKMCGLCARACPAEAIEMLPVSEKRKAPLFTRTAAFTAASAPRCARQRLSILVRTSRIPILKERRYGLTTSRR